jgi:hypothetical protein
MRFVSQHDIQRAGIGFDAARGNELFGGPVKLCETGALPCAGHDLSN